MPTTSGRLDDGLSTGQGATLPSHATIAGSHIYADGLGLGSSVAGHAYAGPTYTTLAETTFTTQGRQAAIATGPSRPSDAACRMRARRAYEALAGHVLPFITDASRPAGQGQTAPL